MTKKIRVKDIANMAGVSPGTVDRVLHNRGNLSAKSKSAVENALLKLKYRPNIHISSLSLKKKYNLVVVIPQVVKGEYWECTQRGIVRALNNYDTIDINCEFCYYDQFDLFSCRETFEKIIEMAPDAVIIGPTFRDETIHTVSILEDNNIPYSFVDSMVEGTSPVAFFASNPYKCGYLICKLMHNIIPAASEFVVFQAIRIGDSSANTTVLRKRGFMDYCHKFNLTNHLRIAPFSVTEPERNKELIGVFFEKNPNVRGAIVLSSRGSVIANYFKEQNIKGVKLICIDITDSNRKAVQTGDIDFVIGQRPQQQGYFAVKALVQHLLYKNVPRQENYMPIDILTQENIDIYQEFGEYTEAGN